MDLCNYVQNNSKIYLDTTTLFNIATRLDMIAKKEVYIFKVEDGEYRPILRLRTPYWKTFPSTMVVPLNNLDGYLNLMDRYSDRVPYNGVILNLL